MLLIGLTGGIASGKSLVSSHLAELGAVVIDADQLAREVVEPGQKALERIRNKFGDQIIRADGTLDRAALGDLIFRDPEKRALLNGITHPAVAALARERIAAAEAANPEARVVYDIPLLVETGGERRIPFDLIVVVHADTETRTLRLMEHRGLSRAEAEHRLNSQASDTERLAIADVIIDNNGTIQDTIAQVDALWTSLAERTRMH